MSRLYDEMGGIVLAAPMLFVLTCIWVSILAIVVSWLWEMACRAARAIRAILGGPR